MLKVIFVQKPLNDEMLRVSVLISPRNKVTKTSKFKYFI